jgi:hypothetical protein
VATGRNRLPWQVGNGSAAVLNVLLLTAIRAGFTTSTSTASSASARARAEVTAYYVFMVGLCGLAVCAVCVYNWLVAHPRCAAAIKANMSATAAHGLHTQGPRQRAQALAKVARQVSHPAGPWRGVALAEAFLFQIPLPALSAFVVHLTSLVFFPGVPCSAPPSPPLLSPAAYAWYCSPTILAAYAVGDLLGRTAAGPKVRSVTRASKRRGGMEGVMTGLTRLLLCYVVWSVR